MRIINKKNLYILLCGLLCLLCSNTQASGQEDEELSSLKTSAIYRPPFYSSVTIDGVIFHAHELVFVAQKIMHGLEKQGNSDKVIEPVLAIPPHSTPTYQEYADEVEKKFLYFSKTVISIAEEHYTIEKGDLEFIMDIFYKGGPNCLFSIPGALAKFTRVMSSIKKQKKVSLLSDVTYENEILPEPMIPYCSAPGWLGLARYVSSSPEKIDGWWLLIGGRFILLKNKLKNKKHLYVSDHGSLENLLKETQENLISFTEQGKNKQLYYLNFFKSYKNTLEKDPQKCCCFEKDCMKLFSQGYGGTCEQDEWILFALSSPPKGFCRTMDFYKTPEYTWDLAYSIDLENYTSDSSIENLPQSIAGSETRKQKSRFDQALERIRYKGEIQMRPFYTSNLNPFFTQINKIFNSSDADKYKHFYILKELLKESGSGDYTKLLRPQHSFGSPSEGSSYRAFSDAFKAYQDQENHLSDQELVKKLRKIMKSSVLTVEEESLYFLPNLIAAWFVSESARYEPAFLSGLLLFDLIESNVELLDCDKNNLYQWRYALIHPRKPEDSRENIDVKNAYGDDTELAQIDGLHPMAHGAGTSKSGSIKDSKKHLQNGQKLSTVHQKEGHLLVHWIFELFNKNKRNVFNSNELFIQDPDYNSIKLLLNAVDKPSKKIINDDSLLSKWKILQDIKSALYQRLESLDLML